MRASAIDSKKSEVLGLISGGEDVWMGSTLPTVYFLA